MAELEDRVWDTLTELKTNISMRKNVLVNSRLKLGVMATQHFKRNLLLNLYREGKILPVFPPAA